MSEKDFDWSDDLDFESLAEEKELAEDFDGPVDSFSDFDDLADYAEAPEEDGGSILAEDSGLAADGQEDGAGADTPAASDGKPARAGVSARAEKVVSPGGLGFLVAACTLAGALGMAGALLAALGANPLALWDPSGFMAADRIFNFQDHPLNLFYLVAVGVVLLTLMGAALASRLGRRANSRIHQSEALLSKLTALRLDNELPWTSEELKADPDTSAFVSDVLGAWRLQQARQVRSAGLEGELRRLEKALRDDSRSDLADRYDHPLVGTLADAMVGWHDELHAARDEVKQTREKDEADTAAVMNLIQDARTWNNSNSHRVEVQASTLRRWSTRFGELADKFAAGSDNQQILASLQGLQKDLARSLEADQADDQGSLDELVDRGSKLAFQIAMEVARLGPRGERLLPLSQSLEELTTQFRQGVAQARGGGADSAASSQAVLTRLEQISVQLVKDGAQGDGALVRTLQDLVPAAGKLAANLEEVGGSFGQQDTRLNTLGSRFAELAGQPFDPEVVQEGEPVHPPEGGLMVTSSDPFGKEMKKAPEQDEVDPFGDAGMTLPGEQSPLADSAFSQDVTPAASDDFTVESFSAPEPAAADHSFGETGGFGSDPFVAEEPEVQAKPDLPVEEEKVYDLKEFGAVRLDDEGGAVQGNEDEDRIYELSEFGAVALN